MSHAQATFTVRQISPTISIIGVCGAMSYLAHDALMETYVRASTPTTHTIVLDCTQLEYLSSGGIGLLITILIRARRQHQRVLAFGLSQHDERTFALTHLDQAIGMYASEAEAIAAAGAQ